MSKDLPERAADAKAVIDSVHGMDRGLVISDWDLSPDGPHTSRLELSVGIHHDKVDFQAGDGDE